MQYARIWVLRGPNIWARRPVLEVELNPVGSLGASPFLPDHAFALLLESKVLPPKSDSDEPFPACPHLARVLQHLTLRLQRLAGSAVSFGFHQERYRDNLSRFVVEYEEETLAQSCLEVARDLCLKALAGEVAAQLAALFSAHLEQLRDLAHEVRLGPSTGAIIRAARQRGIPVIRLNEGSLVQLGHGARRQRIWTAETEHTSALAETIAQDKELTRSLLSRVGVPVPSGRPVTGAEDAWEAAQEIDLPVVVKPRYGNHGRGVATNLTTREQVLEAYLNAREQSEHIVVERYCSGKDYRLLVIGGRLIAAALREPAQVVGNGRSTLAALVEEVNRDPRRSDGHATPLSFIRIDSVARGVLAEQGWIPESIPPLGTRVLIRRNANLSTGGTATDVTDEVHPDVAGHAVDAARAVGLDIAGVDIVAQDISRPLAEQGGAVVEVNAGPGLRMHLEPSLNSSPEGRPVGEAIVEMLFPKQEVRPGRVPLVAVTGVNGKTTTTRLIAHLLRRVGRFVGMTCTDGIYLGGWHDWRRIETRDCSGPRSARSVLLESRVEAAVFETARGGLLREGLGFEHCDVAVVTNIGEGDHLGLRGVNTPEELARVKRVVVESVYPGNHDAGGGVAVLNADDPLVAGMASHCPGEVIFFSRDSHTPLLATHRAARNTEGGGRAVFVSSGTILLAKGDRTEPLVPLASVPLTCRGQVPFQVENVLAAVASAWHLGVPSDLLRLGLSSFVGTSEQLPGRFNVLSFAGATVIVDYAHNPSALSALIVALEGWSDRHRGGRRTVVFSSGNRRDEDVTALGKTLGGFFDRVILYLDQGQSERGEGELNALLREGLARCDSVPEVVESADERSAIELGLSLLSPGDLLLIGVEQIEESLAFLQQYLERREAEEAGQC